MAESEEELKSLLMKLKEESEKAGLKLQFSLVAQSCLTLCEPMNRSMPGVPVHQPTPTVHLNPCPVSW